MSIIEDRKWESDEGGSVHDTTGGECEPIVRVVIVW